MVSLFIFIFLKEMVSLFVENCFDPYIICQRSKWVFTLEYKSDKAIKRIKHRYEKNNSTNSFNRQKSNRNTRIVIYIYPSLTSGKMIYS